ncbi:MAG: PQQ-dependent sugar dehydrogenase [Vulcanimicrobiota bacterium]
MSVVRKAIGIIILLLLVDFKFFTPGCNMEGSQNGRDSSINISLTRVFKSLNFQLPVAMVIHPQGNRWYVLEKQGRIITFENNPQTSSSSVFLDISEKVESAPSEAGLLGFAFDPDFSENGIVYVSYTGPEADLTSYISKFTTLDNGLTALEDSEEKILTLVQPFDNHNGGHIVFGPDGFLYLGFGDGGSAGDPMDNAQNTNNIFGGISRIDVRGNPYVIPSGNPFAGGGGAPELFAWGLRNPWRFNFDAVTGELWAGDVGQESREEIDLIEKGKNYGWPIKEGTMDYTGESTHAGLTPPVYDYTHDEGSSITGGFVYRGNDIPSLKGHYVYGDFINGKIWALKNPYSPSPTSQLMIDSELMIPSFAEDENRELYVLAYSKGQIFKIEPR